MIWATLREDSPRRAAWLAVYGSLRVPIESPMATRNDSPAGVRMFYKLAVGRLTREQRENLIDNLSARFKERRRVIEQTLDDPAHGCPILADDVIVSMDLRAFV